MDRDAPANPANIEKNWQSGASVALRWTACAMLEANKSFRRLTSRPLRSGI
jgi:hypothetical protein